MRSTTAINPQNRFWHVMVAVLGELAPPNEGEPLSRFVVPDPYRIHRGEACTFAVPRHRALERDRELRHQGVERRKHQNRDPSVH